MGQIQKTIHERQFFKKYVHVFFKRKLVEKVISNLDLSRNLVLVIFQWWIPKYCEHELSYILAELFNMCLRES